MITNTSLGTPLMTTQTAAPAPVTTAENTDGSSDTGFNWLDFLKGTSPLLGLLGGGAAVANAYNRLGGIGEAAQQGAMQIAQQGLEQSQFQPFGVTTSTGSMFGYDPATGQVTMGASPEESAFQQQMFGDAGSMFSAAAGPTDAREQAIYDRMRAAQRPEEERQRLALEERLQAQGRGGVRTAMFGGTPEQLAMAKAQAEAQNTAMLGAMGQAQREQAQQAALGGQFLGASYMPQQQLLAAQQASQLFPQLQQRGQLYGAGLYGEGVASGLDLLLGSGLGQAELIGNLGSGLISGLFK